MSSLLTPRSFFSRSYIALQDQEILLHNDKTTSSLDFDELANTPPQARWCKIMLTALNVILFCLSSLFLIVSWVNTKPLMLPTEATSSYSPIFSKLEITLSTSTMNGSLIDTSPVPIYRQPPSPSVDAAWERIANVTPIAVTPADILALNKDLSEMVKFPPSFNLGPEAYVARLDIFHQIHCLNMLRKNIHFEYYYGDMKPSELHKMHTSHCIYMLLQNLMCHVDVDVITHYWTDVEDMAPYPDFNLQKQCRDFEKILEWQEGNSISLERFGSMKKPSGVKGRVMSDEFKELFRKDSNTDRGGH